MVRMYAGFLHPLIHLGFGIEFAQPAIVVEALAQAAVHDGWIGPFLLDAEKHATSFADGQEPPVPIPSLLHAIFSNPNLKKAAHWSDGNKIRDGVLIRAPKEMLSVASQYHIPISTTSLEHLKKYTAEMINAVTFLTSCSQHPGKKPKFDFYYMHCMNSSIFFSSFLEQDESWFPLATKIRFLEWKVRLDLVMYASRRAPRLYLDRVQRYFSPNTGGAGGDYRNQQFHGDVAGDRQSHRGYETKSADQEWTEIFHRARTYEDDGHTCKLIRAVGNGEEMCRRYQNDDTERFVIKGDMWRNIGHMVMDSVSDMHENEPRWVRSCGFEEAWEQVPDLDTLTETEM